MPRPYVLTSVSAGTSMEICTATGAATRSSRSPARQRKGFKLSVQRVAPLGLEDLRAESNTASRRIDEARWLSLSMQIILRCLSSSLRKKLDEAQREMRIAIEDTAPANLMNPRGSIQVADVIRRHLPPNNDDLVVSLKTI